MILVKSGDQFSSSGGVVFVRLGSSRVIMFQIHDTARFALSVWFGSQARFSQPGSDPVNSVSQLSQRVNRVNAVS
ncbi:hypothetical protein Hdeb2414_s0004g00137271 [Helianthus debilis subsp. tardiflorus]